MENVKSRDWKQTLEEFNASGLSARKFAESHGMSYHTLNHQIRKEREKRKSGTVKSPGFIQLPVKGETRTKLNPEIVVSVEDRSVTIKVKFEP